jgi:phosphatidylserine/phosphatidylglycerophosphate/cardiolipin synthase-like enzyme
MTWLLLATGFTGALTLTYLVRLAIHQLGSLPSIDVYFSPKGGCTDAVVNELKQARNEILLLAYSFSSKPIAQALIDAKTRGVHVDIVLDRGQELEKYSDLPFFIEQKLSPVIDAQHAIAHNKVILIDQKTIITGSFNFTHQAEAENGENLLVIKGHQDLITLYRQNFHIHKNHSQPPGQQHAAATTAQRQAA